MTIHIEELTFDCIIGILDFERLEPQSVIINATINYEYRSNNNFINYANLISLIQNDMIGYKYKLLEDALIHLAHKIKVNYPQIKNFDLKITKPNIIKNVKVSLSKSF